VSHVAPAARHAPLSAELEPLDDQPPSGTPQFARVSGVDVQPSIPTPTTSPATARNDSLRAFMK
jgi:hypothetical protein